MEQVWRDSLPQGTHVHVDYGALGEYSAVVERLAPACVHVVAPDGSSMLACSRALGDTKFKGTTPHLVSSEPDVKSTPLGAPAAGDFVVLASDGVWDVFDAQKAVDLVAARLKDAEAAEAYRQLRDFWRIRPALEDMLADRLAPYL